MPVSKNKTLFILDWDDTLFPTNWVMKNNISLSDPNNLNNYINYFQELDRILAKFIEKTINLGKVIIVTNALPAWIELSSVFLPKTSHLLQKVKIVSARKNYRHKSSNMMDWKILAFRDIIDNEFKNPSTVNIISIGDAEYEYQALIALNDYNKQTKKILKSVKFMREPTHEILIDQLEVLGQAIPKIWNQNTHLDLKIDMISNIKRKKCNK
jgi:hypothetical protein